MDNVFVEIKGRNPHMRNSFHKFCKSYLYGTSLTVINDADFLEDNESNSYIFLKIFKPAQTILFALRKWNPVGVEVTSFPEVTVDKDYEDECEITYYKRKNAVDSRMVKHTESCVSLLHIKSGIIIESQSERSKFKNKDQAIKFLHSKLSA